MLTCAAASGVGLGAAGALTGAPDCMSTFTELLPGVRVRCWLPATTSISSGGRTARLVVATIGGAAAAAAESGRAGTGECLPCERRLWDGVVILGVLSVEGTVPAGVGVSGAADAGG